MQRKSDAELVRDHELKVAARRDEIARILQINAEKVAELAPELERIARELAEVDRDQQNAGLGESDWTLDFDWRRHLIKKEGRPVYQAQKALVAERELLLRERRAITHHLITLKSFSAAPVRRVPFDILAEIFLAAKPTDLVAPWDGVGPLISHVCSDWRAISCTQPALWSSFSFPLFGRKNWNWLAVYLERSGSAPLTVEVDARRPLLEGGSNGDRELDLLRAHAHHLHDLRFITASNLNVSGGGPYKGLPPFHVELPRLQALHLTGSWGGLDDQFASVPPLHTLKLVGGVDLASGPHIFAQAQINTLIIDGAGGRWLAPHATLPALRALDIIDLHHPADVTLLLARSQCDLTTLALRNCKVRIGQLLEILESTPHLHALTVIDGHSTMITDRLFQFLTDNPTRLPILSSLNIEGAFAFGNRALVTMLEARTAPKALAGTFVCLSSVDLSLSDRTVKAAEVEQLKRLAGITVSLRCLDDSKILRRVL
ncbi:hypothetical protein B0H11DRAFT_1964415 [Mycena galericulata]|nr:hypothetical protein B0H11DRAFT_1964415 [Mycena galericulata]